MTGWILAILFFAGDVALVACVRQLWNRLIEEANTTEYLSARLAELGIAANHPGAAASKASGSGSTFPEQQGATRAEVLIGALSATAPVNPLPPISTEGD